MRLAQRPTSTVIETPPGFATRLVSSDPLPVTVTVVLCPDASVPDDGETLTSPRMLDGSLIVQCTGPFLAVSVIVLPDSGESTTVVGDTDSLPSAAGGADDDGAAWDGDAGAEDEVPRVGEASTVAVAAGPEARLAVGDALPCAERPGVRTGVPGPWPAPFAGPAPGAAPVSGAPALCTEPRNAKTIMAAATVVAPVPAATCAVRERHREAGGSSGLGKPR